MKKVNRQRMNDEGTHNVWRSYSDMMSGLLLLFVLIMAVCLMQAQKNYSDKLAEQASRLQTQEELEQTQNILSLRESEIEDQTLTLTNLQSALEAQADALSIKESELDEAQIELTSAQEDLTSAQEQLKEQQELLSQQESELEVRDASLAASQAQLDEQNQLMSEQQDKIDQIIGVKADLIAALNQEFSENQISVDIDSQTGAIVLDSNVLFALNEYILTEQGEQILSNILPVYCLVLLSDQYVDYVAEVIIDGYTDSLGQYLTNLTLSQNRAYAVAEYLLSISYSFLTDEQNEELQEKLTANGRSESNLIYDEYGNEDHDASRRVEVKFRLKDDEMIEELSKIISETSDGASSETTAG